VRDTMCVEESEAVAYCEGRRAALVTGLSVTVAWTPEPLADLALGKVAA